MSGEGIHNPADLTTVLDELEVIDGIVDDILVDTTDIIAALVVIDDEVEDLQDDVTLIRAVTDALPTLTETGGTVTTDSTEQNVYINDVPLGVFNPICVKIDFTDQGATETVVIRVYYRIVAGVAAPILRDTVTYVGVVSPELINIDLEPNRFGVRVTMQRTAGNAQDYDWEVFYEI